MCILIENSGRSSQAGNADIENGCFSGNIEAFVAEFHETNGNWKYNWEYIWVLNIC